MNENLDREGTMAHSEPEVEEFVPLPYDGTFESARKCHYHLWDYLARTGEKQKPIIAGILHSCYACSYCNKECFGCPIFSEGDYTPGSVCSLPNRLYYMWLNAQSREERMKIAAQIRDLPWTDHYYH